MKARFSSTECWPFFEPDVDGDWEADVPADDVEELRAALVVVKRVFALVQERGDYIPTPPPPVGSPEHWSTDILKKLYPLPTMVRPPSAPGAALLEFCEPLEPDNRTICGPEPEPEPK